ncbi:MAG: phage tail sheath family protein [Desulfobacteraceae bacterium]|nr:phage tail sheath family protein [Desulfobacteraceae bacterium]
MLGTEQGGIEKSRYSSLRPAPSGTFLDLENLNALSGHPQSYFDTVNLDGNTIDLGTSLETTAALSDWSEGYVDASTTDYDGVREKLAIIASAVNDEGIGWTATVAGSRLFLKKRSGLNNFSAALTTSTNNIGSCFRANTRFYSLGSGTGAFHGAVVPGIEGEPPNAASYKGSEADHTGFYALDLVDLFNLMVIPGDSNLTGDQYRSLWPAASSYCQKNRAFLIIDPPASWSSSYAKVIDPSKGIRKLRIGVVKDNAAVFYPRIVVSENGLLKKIGPGGAIAGLMARTDSNRGVWKAPAGTEADILGISDLELSLTDMENGVLNKEGVNCLRVFPLGIVNWGSRTMDGADDFGSEWKYIPIRRLALFLEESLFRGSKWVVFEPNDEPLWAKIRLNLGAFMMRLFRQGAFQGTTPDKAFFVKCDAETTTQADRNLGIVNIVVGFAPLKPAEFVIIKIQQIAGDL